MLISTEGFLLDDFDTPEVQTLCAVYESANRVGYTPGLEALMRLSSPTEFMLTSLEAQAVATVGNKAMTNPTDDVHHEFQSSLFDKIKRWAAKALAKLNNFIKYMADRVIGFAEGLGKKVASSKITETATAHPVATVTAAIGTLGAAAGAIRGWSAMASRMTSPAQIKDITQNGAKIMASELSSVKGGGISIATTVKDGKLGLDVKSTIAKDAMGTASKGGWTRNTLKSAIDAFSHGAHALWSALKMLVGGVQTAVRGILSGSGSAAAGTLRFGDKAAAGAINLLNKHKAAGGVKGFVFGIAAIMFVTTLVNTALKLIRAVLNACSSLVRDTVDAICGSSNS